MGFVRRKERAAQTGGLRANDELQRHSWRPSPCAFVFLHIYRNYVKREGEKKGTTQSVVNHARSCDGGCLSSRYLCPKYAFVNTAKRETTTTTMTSTRRRYTPDDRQVEGRNRKRPGSTEREDRAVRATFASSGWKRRRECGIEMEWATVSQFVVGKSVSPIN